MRYTQPQGGPLRLDPANPLSIGLFASIEGTQNPWDAVAQTQWTTGSTAPPNAVTSRGVARNTTGGLYDLRRRVDGPLSTLLPWTFATTLCSTANVSLSHVFGFGIQYNGATIDIGATFYGQYRALLNYSNNYYFWGSSADWNTGIAWDTDGLIHTVMFVSDGASLYFYRDGVRRATTTLPSGLVTTVSGAYAVLGNKHQSGANSPSASILSGRAWSRALSASDAKAYAGNEFQLFASPRRILKASALYPTLSNSRFNPATSSGGYPAIDLS